MIICIIPARKGSKSIPDKNIREFNGYPLFVHSIHQAQSSSFIHRIFVSTDSMEYGEIAKQYGAEVIHRPDNISDDLSTDYSVFQHSIQYLNKELNIENIECIVHLRPTYPIRSTELLNNTIQTFIQNKDNYDSLRTVILSEECPFKMYSIHNNILYPLFHTFGFINEPFNQPRQVFPSIYIHNGCIDILKPETIINKKSMSGSKIYPYVMDEFNIDIDTEDDFKRAESRIIK